MGEREPPGVMRYRLAIFDFDGTLADTFPWLLSVFDEIADRYRFRRIDARALDALRAADAATLMRTLGVSTWKLPWIVRHVRRRMAQDLDGLSLFPGVTELLTELGRGPVRLAIVSSNSQANIERVLGPELASLFETYDCGAALRGKTARLRRVLRRSGIPAGEAIYIGDELRDQDAAHASGLAFGAVGWGYAHFEALRAHGPDAAFATVAELRQALLPSG